MSSADHERGPRHVSVLSQEILRLLNPQPGQIIVDATTGAGGHSHLLAERIAPEGRLVGLDQDASMLALTRERLTNFNVTLVQAGFDQLRQVLDELEVDFVDGVLADLGICSDQLDDVQRGFSFQEDGPLDMRMNPDVGESAGELIQRLSERELADVFYHYGEERFSRRIARRVVDERAKQPITTTSQLADLIRSCVPRPKGKRKKTIDPATRCFQALRIAVNDEMGALEGLLAQLPLCIRSGGRAAIISFHSLEDRPVKQTFRNADVWERITRKPLQAGEEEIARNPRSRSAKLRVAQKK